MRSIGELELLEIALDISIASDSLASACRQSVLSPKLEGLIRGTHVFLLDQNMNLIPTEFFGQALIEASPAVAKIAIETNQVAYSPETADAPALLAVPIIQNGMPAGCWVLILKPGADGSGLSNAMGTLLGKVAGCIQESHANQSGKLQGLQSRQAPETLNDRQVQVLELMAEGLTNVKISRKLLLSESTIRQESVRIYRILGTDNRRDAVSNGRSAGLIAKLVLHEPAIAS